MLLVHSTYSKQQKIRRHAYIYTYIHTYTHTCGTGCCRSGESLKGGGAGDDEAGKELATARKDASSVGGEEKRRGNQKGAGEGEGDEGGGVRDGRSRGFNTAVDEEG